MLQIDNTDNSVNIIDNITRAPVTAIRSTEIALLSNKQSQIMQAVLKLLFLQYWVSIKLIFC